MPAPIADTAKSHRSLRFDGVDDYVLVPSLADADYVTISVWIKTLQSSGIPGIVMRDDFTGGKRVWQLRLSNGVPQFIPFDRLGNIATVFGVTSISNGNWRHLAVTWNGSECNLYIDGAADIAPVSFSGLLSTQDSQIWLGFGDTALSSLLPFVGLIDDVAIFNTALTPTNIADLAAGTITPASLNPVGLWKFDDASGSTALDSSGNGNHGTLMNGSGNSPPANGELDGPKWSSDVPAVLAPPYNPGTSTFNPLTISGCQLWLKADTGTYQSSGGAAATADGDPVGEWQDQSGNGNHVTQATSGSKPTLQTVELNGRSIIRFDGTDDFLSVALATTTITVFIVVKSTGGSGNFCSPLSGRGTSGNVGWNVYKNNSGNWAFWAWNGGSWTTLGSIPAGTGYAVLTGIAVSDDQRLYLGRVKNDYAANAYSSNGDGVVVGAVSTLPEFLFVGDIAEILVYDSVLSPTDWGNVEYYLNKRHDIEKR